MHQQDFVPFFVHLTQKWSLMLHVITPFLVRELAVTAAAAKEYDLDYNEVRLQHQNFEFADN